MNKNKDVILNREEQAALLILEDLNRPRGDGIKAGLKTRLHVGQIEALKRIYQDNISLLMQPCGRKFGKTEEAAYFLWKHALENPGSACYYIAPEASHGRKIVWNTHRLQRFLGTDSKKYIGKPREQEMLIPFKNGSFIQVVGSENFGSANGLTPDAAVYDEFKLFHHRWHVDFAPNLVAKAASLLIIGTLPTPGDRNYEQYFEILESIALDPKADVITRTTFDNPLNHMPAQKEAIEAEIGRLRLRGEEEVVQREYYSKIVPGGKKAIFPMLTKERHVIPHKTLMSDIHRDIKKLEWYCITDPGSTTCFATMFAAIHPYTRKMYIVDELYVTDQYETSTRKMFPQMDSKMMEFYPNSDINDDWYKAHDEAAAWFANEVMDQYGVYFQPTMKHLNKKEHGLSLIKDLLLHDMVVISDRCTSLYREMERYAKDDKGNIPKKHDHLIDCFRYLLGASNYNMIETLERKKQDNDAHRGRFRSLEHDKDDNPEDWTQSIGPSDW